MIGNTFAPLKPDRRVRLRWKTDVKQESDSRRSKGKAIAICAALGVLTVAFIGVVFRQDLETQYHLYRIRKDILHALTLIAQPEGTPERRAIRRYIEESLDFHGKLTRASPPDHTRINIISGNKPPSARIDIIAGKIPARECCRFLSDWTGLAAIMDSDLWEAEFTVPESIHAIDAELMGLLLVAHDCSLTVKTLPNERRVVRLRKVTTSDRPSTDVGILQGLSDMPSTDIAEGMITVKDFAAWIEAELDGSVSVDPGAQGKGILVAAPIQNADASVIQELLSANGCFLESNDKNGLRIRAKP